MLPSQASVPWQGMCFSPATRKLLGGSLWRRDLSHSFLMTLSGLLYLTIIRTKIHISSSSPCGFWKGKVLRFISKKSPLASENQLRSLSDSLLSGGQRLTYLNLPPHPTYTFPVMEGKSSLEGARGQEDKRKGTVLSLRSLWLMCRGEGGDQSFWSTELLLKL